MRAWWSRQDDRRKVVIGVAAVVLVMWAVTLTRGSSAKPANVAPAAGRYAAEYGGSASVYRQIAAESDCGALQVMFDTADDNRNAAEPGTAEHRVSLGYMLATGDRMEAIGCY